MGNRSRWEPLQPEEETDENKKRRLLHLWRRLVEVGRAREEREGGSIAPSGTTLRHEPKKKKK